MVLIAQKYNSSSFGFISNKYSLDHLSASGTTIMYLETDCLEAPAEDKKMLAAMSYSALSKFLTEEEKHGSIF